MSKIGTLINNIRSDWFGSSQPVTNLAAGLTKDQQKKVIQWKDKALSLVRTDIKQWKAAWMDTTAEDDPKNWRLQNIYEYDVALDGLVTSQVENIRDKCLGTEFSLKPKGKGKTTTVDEEQTKKLANSIGFRTIREKITMAQFHGYEIMELSVIQKDGGEQELSVTVLPRTNFVPKKGRFYPDYSEDTHFAYREMPEYGSYLIEIDTGTIGAFNKTVPHALMKRFAYSCWSELCEIFGIPPRVLKTDTQNQQMLNRAVSMMKDIGAAAWYIIDEQEKMDFADGVNTNGDVFKQLKDSLNNELSLLISGVIYGQDTVNGNRSKDESAREIWEERITAYLKREEMIQNSIVIPALISIGFLKGNMEFEFHPTVDLDKLWTRTKDSMTEFDVDPVWLGETFGVKLLGKKQKTTPTDNKLAAVLDFFV